MDEVWSEGWSVVSDEWSVVSVRDPRQAAKGG